MDTTLKITKILILFLLFVSIADAVFSQTDPERIDSLEEQFPGLPFYSYGSGLGMTTPDSTFRLNIRFRMQNRTTYFSYDDRDPEIEAVVRRLRLRFDGFVGDPRFHYAIQLSFAPDDVGRIEDGENLQVIRDAVMFYRPNNRWNFAFGQTKLPGNRQRVNSSGALQLTDRSINNATFTIDRDYGVQVYYLQEQSEYMPFNIKTAISTGDGRNWTRNPSTDLAYTGRLELFPLGAFTASGWQFEGDLMREETPKILLAATYHLNKGAQRTQGQRGDELFERRDLTSVLLDGMLKYRGWSYQTSFMNRTSADPITINQANPDEFRFVDVGYGFDNQLSYLFDNNIELIGRYSKQIPGSEIEEFRSTREQLSAGITKYIWEHALKLQTELTYNNHTFADGSGFTNWYARFQVEIGI